jgi:hypothetical protein
MTRLLTILATAALALGALAAPVAADSDAMVRVIHASPDAPNVDVWVDGTQVLTDVPFTAVSDYLALPAGDHQVQVTATGSTDPVIDATLTLEAGTSYTVAATGFLADIGPTVFVDDRTPASDASRLRVIHASPSAPASVDIALADGPILIDGLAYQAASDYLTVDPGTYALEIRAAGDDAAALTIDATVAAGHVYTAIAMDGGDAGVQVIVAVDMAAMPDTAVQASSGVSGLVALGAAFILLSGFALLRRRVAIPAA